MKYDQDKPNISLIPAEFIEEIAKVFTIGAKKYGDNNWRKDLDDTTYSRTYSSIQRHLLAFQRGEDMDPESELPHLSHAATQICILMMQWLYGKNNDDRVYFENKHKLDFNELSYEAKKAITS